MEESNAEQQEEPNDRQVFWERPSEALVKEIVDFIQQTGEPHKWRGHTHTKPAEASRVLYLAEFDLPKSHRMPERWAPCPICTPGAPKYFRDGKIAWFPDEGVIRMIGGDCYKTLVGAKQHDEAMAQLRQEQRARADEAFIIQKLPIIVSQLNALDRAKEVCEALDTFKGRLLPRMGPEIHGPLWQHVRAGGTLRTVTRTTERTMRGGTFVERSVDTEVRYGQLRGYSLLNPTYDHLGPRLSKVAAEIRGLIAPSGAPDQATILTLEAEERSRFIRRLTRLWGEAFECISRARDLKSFLDLVNVRTLRSWAARDDAPISAYFDVVRMEFRVGRTTEDFQAVSIPPILLGELSELPRLT